MTPKKRPEGKKTAGRKPTHAQWRTEEGLGLITQWASEGLFDYQIAREKIGITHQTFCDWKTKYPEIPEALKKGQDMSCRPVENALYKIALGYDYDEERTEISDDGLSRTIKKTITKKHVPPQLGAICFYLRNKAKDRWSNSPEKDGESGAGGADKGAGMDGKRGGEFDAQCAAKHCADLKALIQDVQPDRSMPNE